MSDSDDSLDENIEEAVEVEETELPNKVAAFDRKTLPKHLKQRYWNSWEEMRLVELWRLHFNEVTDLDQNLPIFRTIGAGLREWGFHMNAQEIRRKMKTIKNKYIQESRWLKENGGVSEWRLYRLMHCMMSPRRPNCDLQYQQKQLAVATEKNLSEPLFEILASGMPVNETLKRIESGEQVCIPKPAPFEICFPIENKIIAASILCAYENKHKLSFTPRVFRHNYEVAEQAKRFDQALAALSSKIVIRANVAATSPPTSMPLPLPPLLPPLHEALATFPPVFSQQPRSKFMQGILKTKINEFALEKIRAENRNLMDEVVLATKKLKQEEQQLKCYELIMNEVKSFYEKLYEKIEVSDV